MANIYFILQYCFVAIAYGQTSEELLNNKIQPFGNQEEFPCIIQMLQDSSSKYNFPGFAIGIVKDGKEIFSGATGWADIKKKIRSTSESVYQVGSLTKTFTGNILAHLVNADIMSLDALAGTYFPDSIKFPVDSTGRQITIKDLATYSSGLPRYQGYKELFL